MQHLGSRVIKVGSTSRFAGTPVNVLACTFTHTFFPLLFTQSYACSLLAINTLYIQPTLSPLQSLSFTANISLEYFYFIRHSLLFCISMGNTTSTPTVSHAAPSNYSIASSTKSAFEKRDGHHQPGSRPSTAGLPPSAHSSRSLRKMGSFSTLASSASRFYHHHSPSTLSLSSKPSKSTSSRRKHRDYDTILDIGKPTQFEHGIHVEYNKESGCYMVMIWDQDT